MPIDVFWVNESKTILQYTIEGRWTWDDLYPKYYEALEMERSVSHWVDIVIDLRASRSIPSNVFTHIKNISDKQPENVGLTVIVSENRFIKLLLDMAVKAYPKIGHYFRVAYSMSEALTMIQDVVREREAL